MTEPWEIDPTDPDGEGAGALPPPLQPPPDIDRTNPFEPGGTSTPYPPEDNGEVIELGDMNLDEMEFDPDDIPLLTDFMSEEDKTSAVDKTLRFIKNKYKKVDFKKLGPIGWGKKPENRGEIGHFGPKLGEDRVLKKRGSGLLKSFTDKFKKALGPSSEELLAEENQGVREVKQRLKEATEQLQKKQKDALAKQKAAENVQNLRQRYEEVEVRRTALEEEQGSSLENQNEIDRLKQVEKNLLRDIKNEEIEIKALQKQQQQQQKEQAKNWQILANSE